MKYPFQREPRIYQRRMMQLLYKIKRLGLFFEMGTGKTQIILDFLGVMFWNHKLSSALVICPLDAFDTWEAEIELLWPKQLDVKYHILRPESKDHEWKNGQLIITNFDYARRRVADLMKWGPEFICIDESHRIKNPHARQSKMAKRLGAICTYASILTGTPIGNKPLDLWSQFRFLVPGLLQDTFKEFKEEYSISGGFGGFEIKKYKHLDQLSKIIHPYVRTMKKKDYLELPDKNFIEIPVEMGEKARKHYETMERDFVAYVKSEVTISAPIALAKLTKLSQISGGFIHDTESGEDHPLHTSKLDVLEGICDDLREQGEKRVVIFARFLWEINEIKKRLAPNWATYVISGEVSRAERKLAKSMFNESGGAIICQIASGSVSSNYQSANYMIFYSLDYSFINFSQAQDRIHRLGQTKPCYYYILLAKATLDRRIYRLLKEKRNVAENVIELIKEAQNGNVGKRFGLRATDVKSRTK